MPLPRVAAGLGLFVLAVLIVNPGCGPTQPPPPATSNGEPQPVAVPAGPPIWDDVTKAAGIDATYRNGEDAGHFSIIESLGGGVALFDYDNDGLLDIFVPLGGRFEGQTVLGHPCKLYRNRGNFRFEDVSDATGLTAVSFPYSHGAAAFDYDADGWCDLLVTGYDRLVLLHNEPGPNGGRQFRDATAAAGLTERLWSTSAAWGDLDGDGWPEIYVAHYGDWGFTTNHPTNCTYDGKTRDVCQPRQFKPLPHTLYHNRSGGRFADASAALQPRRNGKGIGTMIGDLDGDGRPDIYTCNDTEDNFLFLNRSRRGQLKLEEVGTVAGAALDDRGLPNGSMGVAFGDVNRSGRPSIVVTNYELELPALYLNRSKLGQPRFTFASQSSGLAAVGGQFVGWGVGFLDYDRDGWQDLFIVNGHAIRFPTRTDRRQRAVLLQSERGRFREVDGASTPYLAAPHNARGLALGDLDNDGSIDAVVSHLNEPLVVLRNVAPTEGRHWLGIDLREPAHRDIVGTRVVLKTADGPQTRFVAGGASYGSTHDPRHVFGLRDQTDIRTVTVHWSDGSVEAFDVQPDRYNTVVKTKGRRADPAAPVDN